MEKMPVPKQSSWEIVYSRFEGVQRRAVEFLSAELGKYLLREKGVYRLHVLPAWQEGKHEIAKNAVVIGRYDESALIRSYIKEEEIPEGGFFVRVAENREMPGLHLVLITAQDDQNLLWGAEDFVDEYPVHHCFVSGGLRLTHEAFDYVPTECAWGSAPKVNTRSIFTWGHPINDYRAYIRNMARMKLNQVIIWNDYMPLNAKEIMDYAHSFGIEVLWGFSWGWDTSSHPVESIDDEAIARLRDEVLQNFEENYRDIACDGIYFQSFTERRDSSIGGRSIADAVTDLVNQVSGELLRRYPKLHIQFGLHAMSVRNNLHEIARVDPRVEIVWEDCGEFPSGYTPVMTDEEKFRETMDFTRRIIELRPGAPVGIVFKGFMTLDWYRFVHQAGPFILGEAAPELVEHDRDMRAPIWRALQGQWAVYGKYAQQMAEMILSLTKGNVNLCMAANFDGGIWLPEAACSQVFWNPERDFGDIWATESAKHYLTRL